MARIIRGPGGGAPLVFYGRLPDPADFVPFKSGKLVFLDADRRLRPTGADPSEILGVALKDALEHTEELIPVGLITPETIIYLDGAQEPAEVTGLRALTVDANDALDYSQTAAHPCVRVLELFGSGAYCIPYWSSDVWQLNNY